ncbi:MAG: sigma-54-dependent Fis family transcriptional regulator [Magnetococcales bacterium]|nr:sigma-54-dependent Fis family transcriptional regulator [Magnetococcales bacterium]
MSANILIVDHDDLLQKLLPIAISQSGHAITVITSFHAAIEALQERSFDLVISALCLPDGSGLQLLNEIQKNHGRTNIIVITSFPDVETVRTALREGAFVDLIKPVIPEESVHAADCLIEQQHQQKNYEVLNNRLEAIFRGVDDAIIVLGEGWRIVQVNSAAIRLLGLKPTSINQLLQDEIIWLFPTVESLLQQALEEGEGQRAVRMITMHEGGVERILNCTASLFRDPTHDTQGTILVVRDESRLAVLERETKTRQGWYGLVGFSQPMQAIYELIERLANVDTTVLITGETGTGKELAARALHDAGPRCSGPFVAVNCAALPTGLLESELFGHVRGAFTNAIRDKQGRFKMADGGTIFLDEIGDIPLETQVRLLRVLQEQVFEAVGDARSTKVDVRVVTATHRNLLDLVREGRFREDLYYRLKVVEIHMPPLREHKVDLPVLVDHFLTKFNARLKRAVKGVSDEVMVALVEYHWPGNVRELGHVLEHAMVMSPQPILVWSNLPPDFRHVALTSKKTQSPTGHGGRPLNSGHPAGKGPDREMILQCLEDSHWQLQVAATRLEISRSTLWRRMKAMGLHHFMKTEKTKD